MVVWFTKYCLSTTVQIRLFFYHFFPPLGSAEVNEVQYCQCCFVSAAATMGQQISGQAVMNHLPEKLVKHAGLVRDSGYLTYEEFLARVAELNDV